MAEFIQNLHTHSTFCDGADTPEEIIEKAIEIGFKSIGFSCHSFMHNAPIFANKTDKTEEYKKEISFLKEKYAGIIDIFCGFEFDLYSGAETKGYDYLIGAVHYLMCDGECVGFDRTLETVADVINKYFDSDGMKYAKEYYKTLSKLPEYGNFDIVAHFDIITKHSDKIMFFDETSDEYLKYVISAAEALSGKIPFFEVNTGAVSRGYRKTPYPNPIILKELNRLGFGAIISSDCHDKNKLTCGFEDAKELLIQCGFKEQYILTKNGFESIGL